LLPLYLLLLEALHDAPERPESESLVHQRTSWRTKRITAAEQ